MLNTKILDLLNTEFSSLKDLMSNCSHHSETVISPFHMEGDILKHTMMVYDCAKEMYPKDDILQSAILLHDLGKPMATGYNENNGRKNFIGHAGLSFYLAIDVLNKLGDEISVADKKMILNIISLHGEFYGILNPEVMTTKFIKKVAERFTNQIHLMDYVFRHILCDHLGRITDEVFDKEVLNNAIFNDILFQTASNSKQYVKKKAEVVFMVGPPNCGKTTYQLANYANCNVLSRDDVVTSIFPVDTDYNECFRNVDHDAIDKIVSAKFKELLNKNKTFVIDMTNMTRKFRRKYLSNIPKNIYNTIAIVFATGYNTIMERNGNRVKKTLAKDVIVNKMRQFMVPAYDEFDEINWIF